MEWETIINSSGAGVLRTPILGGWLVMVSSNVITQVPEGYSDGYTYRNEMHHEFRSSVTFVPDPNHSWDPEKDYKAISAERMRSKRDNDRMLEEIHESFIESL